MAKPRKKLEWSKFITLVVVLSGLLITQECMYLMYLAITNDWQATAAYLTAAIGLGEAVIGVGLSAYMSVIKVDHRGANGDGITYAAARATNFGQGGKTPVDEAGAEDPPEAIVADSGNVDAPGI